MPRDLLLMSISLFTWGLGEGMFLYFQPLYLQKWGANPVEIGGILGAMGIAMAAVQAPSGYLTDRVGSRPIMWSAWLLGALATTLMALARSLPVFVAGMIAYGLTSFVNAPMNSYIIRVRGKWGVERSLTFVSSMYNFGAVAGPIIGGLIGERLGLPVVYRISAIIFCLSTSIIFFIRKPQDEAGTAGPTGEKAEPVSAGEKRPQFRQGLAANPRFLGLLGIALVTIFALYLPQPLTPNYLQNQHGFNLETIGWMGATGNLGNAVLMLALGHLSAPVGFLAGQVLVAVFALIMWLSNSPLWFFIGYFFIGGYRLSRTMVLALARSLVKPDQTGMAFGLVETGNAIAAITAPLAAGFLYNHNPVNVYIGSLVGIGVVILVNIASSSWMKPAVPERVGMDPAAVESHDFPDG